MDKMDVICSQSGMPIDYLAAEGDSERSSRYRLSVVRDGGPGAFSGTRLYADLQKAQAAAAHLDVSYRQ